jgi:hypothetical protein
MYTDLYLAFADQVEADSILYTDNAPNYQNIDTLGILYVEQPIPDPENPPEPILEEGWHVNVRLLDDEDPEPLIPFQVYPTVPRRVWG